MAVEAESAEPAPAGPSLFEAEPAVTDNLGPPPPPRVLIEDESVTAAAAPEFEPSFSLEKVETGAAPGLSMIILALVGLVVFAGGVFWGLNAAPDPAGDLPVAKAVGWALGVAGVICFGIAAYGLLRRLGGEDETEE